MDFNANINASINNANINASINNANINASINDGTVDFEHSVIYFKPKCNTTNLIIMNKYVVSYCYFSLDPIQILNNYFKVIFDQETIKNYLRSIQYMITDMNLSSDHDSLQLLQAFLVYAQQVNRPVIVSIPLSLNQEETSLSSFNSERAEFSTILKKGMYIAQTKADIQYGNFSEYRICTLDSSGWINNILVGDEVQGILKNVIKSMFSITQPLEIIINKEVVASPCAICKLAHKKIGDICIYKTNNYECLFNCEYAQQVIQAENEFNSQDINSLKEWEASKEAK